MSDPIPIPPVDVFEVGRDNYSDGVLGSGEVYSTVRVINLTPHQSSEIKTSVITLEKDAFKVTTPNSLDTPPISVSSIYGTGGFVQWEPMGDLYEATLASPLGSYKLLRVKWDCKVPAGRNDNDYAVNGSVSGPYEYYSEVFYNFVAEEPAQTPSFNLTNAVKTALGIIGNDKVSFEFSAHGYVNSFDFVNGLYGQDKQTRYPDGSGLIQAFRDKIYDPRDFTEIGSTTDSPVSPNSGGEACLAKEYELHGRIVPELDNETFFDTETWDSSGNDAPPFWYNFYYELQHNKNIIPFTFMWGVDTLNYDDGTYDPRGKDPDLKDARINKLSSNHGPRLRSQEYLEYILSISGINKWNASTQRLEIADETFSTPNLFYSNDDITFSIIGPEVVSHASSVNVCSVSYDTVGAKNKTIFNWFDKANASWYDIKVFGINNLPCHNVWILRGCLLLNDSYIPIQLSQEDINAQNSIRSERTWAIDQNFYDRKLFGAYKNSSTKPPQNWLTDKGYVNGYQSACKMMYTMWESPIKSTVDHTVFPQSLATTQVNDVTYYTEDPIANPGATPITIDLSQYRNPFYGPGVSSLEIMENVGFLKGLHEPWAFNPLGLNTRPGIQGGQPGFSVVGGAGINATIGLPDMRAWEAAVDLEWNRLTVEANRDGSIVNPLDDMWTRKRFKGSVSSSRISNSNLEEVGKVITNDPNYSFTNKSFSNSLDFSGVDTLIDESSMLCYFGTNPTYTGTSSRGFSRGYPLTYYRPILNISRLRVDDSYSFVAGLGSLSVSTLENVYTTAGQFKQKLNFPYYNSALDYKPFGHPAPKKQYSNGYPGGTYCQINNGKRQSFTNSHSAYAIQLAYAVASGDKISLKLIDHYMQIVMCSHDDNELLRGLFASDTYAEGQGHKPVGRMEGRPMQGLIGGLGITRDTQLRERALYMLSRRFWNNFYIADWEDYPRGVPGKAWRPITYPAWSHLGIHRKLDQDGYPYNTNQIYGVQINRISSFDKYYKYFVDNYRGDFFYRKYLPSRLDISSVAPNFDRSKSSSWSCFPANGGFDHKKQMIYVNPYLNLEEAREFLAPGIAVYNDGSRVTQTVSYKPYCLGVKGDTLDTDKYVIPPFISNPPPGVVSVEGIPGTTMFSSSDPTEVLRRQWQNVSRGSWTNSRVFRISSKGYSQAYQQALLYPFLDPILEMFNAYSTVFDARKAEGLTPDFTNRFNDYEILSNEFADTYEEMRAYYLQAAKSTIRNSLIRISSSELPELDGNFLMRYFSSPFSHEKPFENFTDNENVVVVDGNGNIPAGNVYVGTNGINSGESWPWLPGLSEIGLTSSVGKPTQEKRELFNGTSLVSYIGVVYLVRLGTGPDILTGTRGTNIWALIAIIWAWEKLSRYGDLNDSYITQCLLDAQKFIESSLGPVAYDPVEYASDNEYAKWYNINWGLLGWGSPGNSANFGFNQALGHPEYFPNIDGVLNDHWKDRDLTNVYLNLLRLGGSTTLDSTLTVDSNFSLVTLAKLTPSGSTLLNSTPFSIYSKFVEGSVRDYANDCSSTVSGLSELDARKYLEVEFFNDLDVGMKPGVSSLTLSTLVDFNYSGESNFSLILPKLVIASATFPFEGVTYVNSLVGIYDLPSFESSFSLVLSSTAFSKYRQLGSAFFDFSSELSSGEFETLKGVSFALSGALSNSLSLNKIVTTTNPGFLGSLEFSVLGDSSLIDATFSGGSTFGLTFQHLKGSGWGESSFRSSVGGYEETLISSSLDAQIKKINEDNQILSNRSLYKYETKIWKELVSRTRGDEKITEIYKDTLEYMISLFSDLVYINDENELKPVPCWHGMMDRIIAKRKKEANIILPVASIFKASSQPNDARKKYGTIVSYERYWNKETNRAVRIASLPSVPITMTYRLNIWAKYQEDLDHIAEQIHRMFSPDVDIYTKYNSTTKAFLIKESDEPPTSLKDGENRILRKTYDIRVESHIPSPKFLVTNTGKIESIVPTYCVPINPIIK